MTMIYEDGSPVEVFDHVDLRIDGRVVEGQITGLWRGPREVRVVYRDWLNVTRRGEPRVGVARVPVSAVELVRRDG